jgi:hypothetical protein
VSVAGSPLLATSPWKPLSVALTRLARPARSPTPIAFVSGMITQDAWSTANPPGPNDAGLTTIGPWAAGQFWILALQVQIASMLQYGAAGFRCRYRPVTTS